MLTHTNVELVRVADVAAQLGVASRTVQLWAESGKLRAFKLGRAWRFTQADVTAFLLDQQQRDPE